MTDTALKPIPYVDGLPNDSTTQASITWLQTLEPLNGASSNLGNDGQLNRVSVQLQENIKTLEDNQSTVLDNIDTLSESIDSINETIISIEDLKDDVKQSQEDIVNLQTDDATNKSDISNLKSTSSTNTSDITSLKISNSNNIASIAILNSSSATNTSDITNLKTEVSTNTTNISTNTSDILGLKSSNITINDNITDLQNDSTKNTDGINQLNNTFSSVSPLLVKTVFSSTGGGTLTSLNDFMSFNNNLYYWTGTLPKVVAAGTSPITEGIGNNLWAVLGDNILREDLSSVTGSSMIGTGRNNSTLDKSLTSITPEMFGAVGDGTTDDTAALQSAFNYMVGNPNTILEGRQHYGVSNKITLVNYSYGMRAHLHMITALSTFPTRTDWRIGTPIFEVGGSGSAGGMVGINLIVDYIDGSDLADIMQVSYYGCGGSRFHFGDALNMINGITTPNNKWPSSSNHITGGYWRNFQGQAFRIGKIPEYPDNMTNEAWVIDIDFITGCLRVAYYLRTGAMYTNIRGQSDFNGYNLLKLYFNEDPIARCGDKITTSDSIEYEVICYSKKYSVDNALIIDAKANQQTTQVIKVGDVITFNSINYTVGAIDYPTNNNWYPDILHDYYDSSGIAKCLILSPYAGGIDGSFMFSSDIHIGNSAEPYENQWSGIALSHSGTNASVRDHYQQREIIGSNTQAVYPGYHLLMRDYRVYGYESYTVPAKSTPWDIRTFSYNGDGTVSGANEVYRGTYTSVNDDLYGEYLIYVNSSGTVRAYKIVSDDVLSVTYSGSILTFEQTTLSTAPVVLWTFLRIL